jgi:hypothetical protein
VSQVIDLNELNDYSTKVYEYLAKNYKELADRVTLLPSDLGKKYVLIKIESPNKEEPSTLYLATEQDELTVGFSDFHCHFDSYSDVGFEAELAKAVQCFYKILREELFVVCAGGGASTLLTSDEIKMLENGQKLEQFPYDCINYYVTSWSGTHDRVFKNPN